MDDRDWKARISHLDAADEKATWIRVVPGDSTEAKASDFEPHDLVLIPSTHELVQVQKPARRNRIRVRRGVGSEVQPIPAGSEAYIIGRAAPRA